MPTVNPRRAAAGRIAAYEFLVNTPAVAALIAEEKLASIDDAIETGKKYGMQLLDEHLVRLVTTNVITADDALEHARNPAALQAKLGRGGESDSNGGPQLDPWPTRPDKPPPGLSAHGEPAAG